MIIVQRQYQVYAYSGSRRSPKTSARPLGPGALPTVSDAVVLPVMQKGVAQSLAAFVVVSRRGMESEFEMGMRLRAQLSERLPAYMLPRRIFFYDAFPITASGKIDRRKLAESVE
jgi:D-alanine--poly(phosphoribitol) ligase subunit 1